MTLETMPAGLDLRQEILRLKQERRAVILAHNYQIAAIQEIADHVGDSLGLAYRARETDAEVIAFCGVHFMAETAKIVNPTKTVVLPDVEAGCSLEESCPGYALEAFLRDHADRNYYVIAYINCSAHVKALADVICTSGNAARIVESAPAGRPILFVPDQNLGSWVIERTGRPMDLWEGACHVHVEFTPDAIRRSKQDHPGAAVVAHPECVPAVRALADEVCSTEKMVAYCRDAPQRDIIVVTESGMLHRLRREVPGKNFIAGPTDTRSCSDCRYMKMNTLEKLHRCLRDLRPEIVLPEDLRRRTEAPILRMLELSREPGVGGF